MNKELYDEAIRSGILSRKLIEQLMESMNYSSISFINWTVEVLKIIKTRLERGDKITDEVSGITYDIKSFRNFVSTNFSSYITSQVFDAPDKAEKVYFSLEATEDGHAYNMVMASSSKNKTYKWISSLSERFSLVEFVLYYAILKIMHNITRCKSISAFYNSTICPFSTSYLQYLPFPEING